jgi:ATP-dependent exoDNAse (exonuclease V) alpha subunit
MAIFHFTSSIVKRSIGRSVVAAAAWQRGIDLHDERLDRVHHFTTRGLGFWSAVLLPRIADPIWTDPERLWNAVEAREARVDAQLARSIKMALPYELGPDQNADLARNFTQRVFVDAGMVVDVTVRLVNDKGEPCPFVNLLTAMRAVIAVGGTLRFTDKVRDWNSRATLMNWRTAWADSVNDGLRSAGSAARVDHRSMAARGLDVEPQINVGVIAKRRHERGLRSDRVIENHVIIRRRTG